MSEPLSTPELRERLCRWLQLQIPGAQQLDISEFTSPEAGASNETLLFTASWLEEGEGRERGLVARLKPSGQGIFPSYNLACSTGPWLRWRAAGVPVPAVLALEEDDRVLGRPFYVMEQVQGRYLADNPPYHMDGWLTRCSPDERGAIWRNAIREIAKSTRWFGRSEALAKYAITRRMPRPWNSNLSNTAGFCNGRRRRTSPIRSYTPVWRGLQQHQPDNQPIALCWGDAKASNLMMQGTDICATLDWEMVAPGQPCTRSGLVVCARWQLY